MSRNDSLLKNFFHSRSFNSIESLRKDCQEMETGAVWIGLPHDPVRDVLENLPPHSGYAHDIKILNLTGASPTSLPQIAEALMADGRFAVVLSRSTDVPWVAESAFAFHDRDAVRTKPLLLNFSSNPSVVCPAEFPSILHVGLQLHSTGREYVDAVLDRGDKILFLDQIRREGLNNVLAEELLQPRPLWIRFNPDVLAASDGGGEKSWATGLQMSELLETLQWLARKAVLCGISLGPCDHPVLNSLSVRTCAQLLTEILFLRAYNDQLKNLHKGNS